MAADRPYRFPRAGGCLLAAFWLGLLLLAVLCFLAAAELFSHEDGRPAVRQFAWWLTAGGTAAVFALVAWIIIIARLVRFKGDDPNPGSTTRHQDPPPGG